MPASSLAASAACKNACKPPIPFGKSRSGGRLGKPCAFLTGKERDPESANDYFGARYYWNGAGRWLAADSVRGRPSDPQGLNRYSYVENDPVNFVDPDGRIRGPINPPPLPEFDPGEPLPWERGEGGGSGFESRGPGSPAVPIYNRQGIPDTCQKQLSNFIGWLSYVSHNRNRSPRRDRPDHVDLVNGASALLKLRNEVGLGNIAIVTGRWADFWLKNDWGGVWPWEEDQLYLHSRIWGEGVTGFPVTGIPHEELPVSALLHELIELGGNLLGWDDETVDITALGVQAEFHDWLARRGEKPCQIEP